MNEYTKFDTPRVTSFSAQDIRGERMPAALEMISQTIAAEIAEAMQTGEARKAPVAVQKALEKSDRKAKSVSEVVLKHMTKADRATRRRIAEAMMTRDVFTGQKLSAATRGEMRALVDPKRKMHLLDDELTIKRIAQVLQPRRAFKKGDIVATNRFWLGLLEETTGSGSSGTQGGSGGGTSAPAQQQYTTLAFQLHEVICDDDTNELARDEIAVGAVSSHGTLDEADAVTSAADAIIAAPHDLGQYRTGDSRTLPPHVVESFVLSGLTFPRLFIVNLALAEVDHGGFADFLQDLYEAVETYLVAIFTAVGSAIGAAIGAGAAAGGLMGTIGGPLGSLIGAAIGVVVGAIVGAITMAAGDEIFEVHQCAIELPSRSAMFNGSTETPLETATYMGFGGQYRLRYNWRLS